MSPDRLDRDGCCLGRCHAGGEAAADGWRTGRWQGAPPLAWRPIGLRGPWQSGERALPLAWKPLSQVSSRPARQLSAALCMEGA